tara:strand:+ start:102 stop:293 length:192 start_codon:yes stop_codon:yes gene_type:complete
MINLTSGLLVIAWLLVLAFGSSESKHFYSKQKYRYEKPNDWAEDSTLNRNKRDYIEYLYNKSK